MSVKTRIDNAILGVAFRRNRNGRVTQNQIRRRIDSMGASTFFSSDIVERAFKSLEEQGLIVADKKSHKLTPAGKRKVASFRKVGIRF